MKTLILNRANFLNWYFLEANFNANVFDALLSDGKYELDLFELLYSVTFVTPNLLEGGQDYTCLPNGCVDLSNVTLKIN